VGQTNDHDTGNTSADAQQIMAALQRKLDERTALPDGVDLLARRFVKELRK
jgi:hypothetical protein